MHRGAELGSGLNLTLITALTTHSVHFGHFTRTVENSDPFSAKSEIVMALLLGSVAGEIAYT